MPEALIMDAMLRSARMFALLSASLVAFDAPSVLLGEREQPPHRPKVNAIAWLIASGVVVAMTGFLIHTSIIDWQMQTILSSRLALAVLWLGLGTAFTVRAMSRSFRPRLIALAAFLMPACGTVFSMMDMVG